LEVWDDRAGRYLTKSIFSGGTRNQISLGLRLAFALATLPQELGTAPGFIFLDEPLSSFDGPRTRALVDLITGDGLIARSFAQVFVISHSRAVDPQQFRYHLRMDGGYAVSSDLPPVEQFSTSGQPVLVGAAAR
jgi:DNA repair exonuclease SbcCD ATPase subunit